MTRPRWEGIRLDRPRNRKELINMTKKLYELIECAFCESAFEEALIEAIADYIDYEAVADAYLNDMQEDITEAASDIAKALY